MNVSDLITICALLSTIITSVWVVHYQVRKTREFDKEKIELELFADFIAICGKKSFSNLSEADKTQLFRLICKLQMVTDEKICILLKELYELVSKENCDNKELENSLTNILRLFKENLKLFKQHHKSPR